MYISCVFDSVTVKSIVQSCSYFRAQAETVQPECLPAHETDTNKREISPQ